MRGRYVHVLGDLTLFYFSLEIVPPFVPFCLAAAEPRTKNPLTGKCSEFTVTCAPCINPFRRARLVTLIMDSMIVRDEISTARSAFIVTDVTESSP